MADGLEVAVAAGHIRTAEGSRVLVVDSQEGHLGLAVALANPHSTFYLYDASVRLAQLSAENAERLKAENVVVLHGDDPQQLARPAKLDVVIYQPKAFSSLDLIENTMALGIELLRPAGAFFLIAQRKRGGVRHRRMLERLLDSSSEVVLALDGGYKVIRGTKVSPVPGPEVELRRRVKFRVLDRDFEVETEPSLFSKDGLDMGTRALLEFVELRTFNRLLDVGCGWGAIGLVAAAVNARGRVVMIDVDRRAVRVAHENALRLGLENRVKTVATDDPGSVAGSFDLILSNPPFHASMGALTFMMRRAGEKLADGGLLHLVAERTYSRKLRRVLERALEGSTLLQQDVGSEHVVLSASKPPC